MNNGWNLHNHAGLHNRLHSTRPTHFWHHNNPLDTVAWMTICQTCGLLWNWGALVPHSGNPQCQHRLRCYHTGNSVDHICYRHPPGSNDVLSGDPEMAAGREADMEAGRRYKDKGPYSRSHTSWEEAQRHFEAPEKLVGIVVLVERGSPMYEYWC